MNGSGRSELPSREQPREYYDFGRYVSPERMATYWHQIREILALGPARVLEVGVGTGLVASYLRAAGVEVTTVDINEALGPDVVGSVLELDRLVPADGFDVVLCARVLHHLPFEDFPRALEKLAAVTRRHVVLTLPVEDFSVSFSFRYTAGRQRWARIPLPMFVKRALFWGRSRSGLWKIGDSHAHRLRVVSDEIGRHFHIEKAFRIPEDTAHQVFVCRVP